MTFWLELLGWLLALWAACTAWFTMESRRIDELLACSQNPAFEDEERADCLARWKKKLRLRRRGLILYFVLSFSNLLGEVLRFWRSSVVRLVQVRPVVGTVLFIHFWLLLLELGCGRVFVDAAAAGRDNN